MKSSDLQKLTPEQCEYRDESVKQLFRRNLYAMCASCGIDTKDVTAPTCVDVLRFIWNLPSCQHLVSWFDEANSFEKLFIVYAISGYGLNSSSRTRNFRKLLSSINDVCYFMACNDYSITCKRKITRDVLDSLNDFDIQVVEYLPYKLQNLLDTDLSYVGITFEKVIKAEQDVKPDDTVPDDDADSVLPVDLRKHLKEQGSVTAIALEVCRLQMLGPKYRRADDAVGALVNAWNTIKTTKE